MSLIVYAVSSSPARHYGQEQLSIAVLIASMPDLGVQSAEVPKSNPPLVNFRLPRVTECILRRAGVGPQNAMTAAPTVADQSSAQSSNMPLIGGGESSHSSPPSSGMPLSGV